MKTIITYLSIAFMALSILSTSCGKDDNLLDENDSKKTEQSLNGKWYMVRSEHKESPGDSESYTPENGEYIEFRSGGKGTILEDKDDKWEIVWKVEGNKLYFGEDKDDYDEFIIVKITKDELEFKEEGSYTNEDQKRVNYVTTYYLKK